MEDWKVEWTEKKKKKRNVKIEEEEWCVKKKARVRWKNGSENKEWIREN